VADTGDREAARAVVRASITPSDGQLLAAVKDLYGETFAVGSLSVTQQLSQPALPEDLTAAFGTSVTQEAWSNWTPGNVDAGALLGNGGLSDLLGRSGVTVKGITDTLLDQMGTVLADGVSSGLSVDQIAANMSGLVDDPDRAFMIANTETARATEAASQSQYTAQGVKQWQWLLSPGACPLCTDNQSSSPFPVGGGPGLPAHPSCRCSSAPLDPGTGG
jgi:hypothetical protein